MENYAGAHLKIILGTGVEHGVDIVDFTAERHARIEAKVCAAAGLKCKTILAFVSGLRIYANAADERVNPRRPATTLESPSKTAAARVHDESGLLTPENIAAESGK